MNKVTLVLRDGSRRTATVRYYRGHSRNPMSDAELLRKYREQTAPVLGQPRADALAEAVWNLSIAPDLTRLLTLAAANAKEA